MFSKTKKITEMIVHSMQIGNFNYEVIKNYEDFDLIGILIILMTVLRKLKKTHFWLRLGTYQRVSDDHGLIPTI